MRIAYGKLGVPIQRVVRGADGRVPPFPAQGLITLTLDRS